MPEQPSFPPAVNAVLGDIDTITTPKQGATSQVWIVECAIGDRVVKHAPTLPFRDWLWREADVLYSLMGSGLPIPHLYFTGRGLAQPYIVMSRLPGQPLSSVMLGESDPHARRHWMSTFGTMLRRIHTTPAPPALRSAVSWLDERLDTAANYLQAGFELDAADPPYLLAQLRAERPAPVTPTLIHGDCMWDNVLVHDGHITGLVDWGGAAYGDPRYDLALAILPREDGDLSPAEIAAFYAAYGCAPLNETEYHYFTNLYGFF